MERTEIRYWLELSLDSKWVSNYTAEELDDHLKDRLNTNLGFRGNVGTLRRVRVVQKGRTAK